MKSFIAATTLAVGANAAAAGDWGYKKLGADWDSSIGAVGAQCATGKQQSPIDLSTASAGAAYSVAASGFENTTGMRTFLKGTKYNSKPHGAIYLERDEHPDGELDLLHIKDDQFCAGLSKSEAASNKKCLHFNGAATITLNRAEGSAQTYNPAQIHMHAPSEHTIDGKYYDLEAHMVMTPGGRTGAEAAKWLASQQAQMGDPTFQFHYSVLGVMFYASDCTEAGAPASCKADLANTNAFFDSMKLKDIWADGRDWSTESNYEVKNGYVPLQDFIYGLDLTSFFSYEGSLTTPPCAEGIRWTVLKKAMPIRSDLMALIKSKYSGDMTYASGNGNNRAIQPLNGRTVAFVGGSAAGKYGTTGASAAAGQYVMQGWTDKQFGSWVVMGSVTFLSAMYWMQFYYYHFWWGYAEKYAAEKYDAKLWTMNTYGVWSLAETINVIVLLFQWVPSALVWILTFTNESDLIYFWIQWVGWMHYVDAVRFVVTSIIKVISFWADSNTTAYSYKGLEKTYKVSKDHALQYWDFAMEWMGFMASFGVYMELHTIIEDMDYAKKKVYAKKAVQRAAVVSAPAANDEDTDLQW